MNLNKIIILILLVLAGCDKLASLADIEWKEIRGVPPATQEAIAEIVNVSNGSENRFPPLSEGSLHFISKESMVTLTKNSAIVIDTEGVTPQKILIDYNMNPNALFVTLHNEAKTRKVKNFIFSMRPLVVFDNGVNTETRKDYTKYITKLGIKSEIISRSKAIEYPGISLEVFVPFEGRGYFDDIDKNSISIRSNNVLYMSNCFKDCEDQIDNRKVKYIVLANKGQCPTNSYDFVSMRDAEFIIGEELCPDFLSNAFIDDLEQLSVLGITFIKIDDVVVIEDE